MRRALVILAAAVVCVAACKDGVTPDCTTDPTVCAPLVGGEDDAGVTVDGGPDAADAG